MNKYFLEMILLIYFIGFYEFIIRRPIIEIFKFFKECIGFVDD